MVPKASKQEIGKRGEYLAERIYTKLGHTIIQKNVTTRFGEIDLITTFEGVASRAKGARSTR